MKKTPDPQAVDKKKTLDDKKLTISEVSRIADKAIFNTCSHPETDW